MCHCRHYSYQRINTGKTYTKVISNTTGQKVYSQQVVNTGNTTIHKDGLQPDKYWLSLYDAKKRVLIGTVSLIKE